MKFNLTPNITKDYLLKYNTEETYMEYYLGVKVTKKLICNPLRQDKHPTASFFRNSKGELIFHDFNGTLYANFVGVVMAKYSCTYHQALSAIAKDFHLLDGTNNFKTVVQSSTTFSKIDEPSDIRIETKEFSKEELEWWNQYGITLELLNKYKVFSCKTVFLNGNIQTIKTKDNLIFGYYGGKMNGKELWRVYYPKRKEYRFLTNWPSKKVQGYKQLPKSGNLLIITKSMKDTMCLRGLGIIAIAPNSETQWLSKTMLSELKERFKYIVTFYDNDRPGLYNMAKIRKEHSDLFYFYIPKKFKAKDISDFYMKYGREKTLKFIKHYITKLSNYVKEKLDVKHINQNNL